MSSRGTLAVQVTLNASRWPEAREDGHRRTAMRLIKSRVEELMGDLQLPTSPELVLEVNESADAEPAPLFRCLVEGAPCRVECDDPEVATVVDAGTAARAVGRALYFNRNLLLTPRVLDMLHEHNGRMVGDRLKSVEPAFAGIVSDFVEAGFSAGTAFRTLRDWPWGLRRVYARDYQLETLMSAAAAESVTVLLAPRLFGAVMTQPSKASAAVEVKSLNELQVVMRNGLFYELGVRFPRLVFRLDEDLEGYEFRARFNELRGPVHMGLADDEALVNESPDRLALLGIKGRPAVNPANLAAAAIVDARDTALCESAGLTTWNSAGFVVLALAHDLRRHASSYMTSAECEYALHLLDEAFPMLVFNSLERYSVTVLRHVLAGLVDEGVSIRDLRSILEALLEINGETDADRRQRMLVGSQDVHLVSGNSGVAEADRCIEYVRGMLKRQITQQHAHASGTVSALLLSPALEERLSHWHEAPLEGDEQERLIAALSKERPPGTRYHDAVLLTGVARRQLRQLLHLEYPHLAVLAYDELAPDSEIARVGRIGWDAPP